MALRTRITPLRRQIDVIVNQALSPEAQSKALAGFARQKLVEAQEINRKALGTVPAHETFVDARRGAALESVKPDGTIVFEFKLVSDALTWIGEQLQKHSPRRSGQFIASHLVLADGVPFSIGDPLPSADEYVFVNAQPYARKIERGHSRQAPDGVFQVVAVLASKRFGNLARIRFGYHTLSGGAVGRWAAGSKLSSRGHAAGSRRDDWLRRQPAIYVKVK